MRVLRFWVILLLAHIILLVLAATDFSILPFLGDDGSFGCELWKLRHSSGWGKRYVSEYSIWQILCYLAAYGLGIPVFAWAARAGWAWLASIGVIVCGVGFISFAIEGSHWLISHNRSLIASFPVVLPVLWALWLIMAVRFWMRKRAGE
jgi:hypothetical protein